jgi:Ca2+-binding RTX toxin-like protein
VTASVTGDTLTISGTPRADRIALRLAAGDPNTLQVDVGDDGTSDQSFDRGTFRQISVLLGNGDDSFRVDQVNGAFADKVLTVDGGNGDDTIVGGDGNDTLIGGNGRDNIDGKRGADTALLGAGDDSFTWDPGEGSDTIEGGDGYDTLIFHGAPGAETMSLSANGTRTLFVRDVGNIRMDMGDVEALDLAALGGADKITINDTAGSGFAAANIDLSTPGAPDGAADVVTVNGTPGAEKIDVDARDGAVDVRGFSATTHVTGSVAALDQLQVHGLGGRDSARIGADVSALIGIALDLT